MHSVNRREFLGCVSAGLAAGAFVAGQAAAADAPGMRPNVVFILADDLGYGDLGCYGQQRIKTPNLDRMAQEGTRFTQCYAGAPVCAPSRCCLMTGQHNGHGRVRDNVPPGVWLQPDDLTVAEVLKQAGYHTGAIGKWSLGNPGSWGVANWQGFDYFHGHLSQDQAHFYYPDYLWENDQIVELSKNRGAQTVEYTDDLFTEKALGFIREHQQEPFFLYLPYTLPHWSDYDKKTPESHIVPSDAPYADESWPQVEKNFAAMVTRLDGYVGQILDLLKELGLDSNTLVMFASDNGPDDATVHDIEFFNSNGALRGVKREMYEGAIRVPMIARWPSRVPAGKESDQVWAFWDMLPTLAELAGLPAPEGIDGISMLPALLGQPQPREHESLYWDYGHTRGQFTQAVRMGPWKGVRNGQGRPIELYNLEADLSETRDVAKEHPEIVQRVEEEFKKAFSPSSDYPIAPPTAAK